MNKIVLSILATLSVPFLSFSSTAAVAQCEDELLPKRESPILRGSVTPEVLARLRDPGPIYHWETNRPILSLSPDKRSVAFEIHRGDPVKNDYCVGLAILSLKPNAKPNLVDVGHELILDRRPSKGWATFESGVPLPVTPQWAPNGSWVAFLKRVNGSTQVWRADLSGNRSVPLTQSETDVDDFRVDPSGRMLIYAARPDVAEKEREIDREGGTGWHYDRRMLPLRGPRPKALNVETKYFSINLENAEKRLASVSQIRLFDRPPGVPKEAPAYAAGPNGQIAWLSAADSTTYPSSFDIIVQTNTGQRVACRATLCDPYAMTQLWWTGNGGKLRFIRREGWARSLTAIYEWVPGKGAPTRVYATVDALIECHPLDAKLLCFRERSNEPRHIVLLDLEHRRERTMFESNPELSSLTLGRVERRQWRNPSNIQFFGDLVYPVGYVAGYRYPLVVVQYRTRGFLRGGVGDEMPIQAFANRGYFVLVFDIGDESSIVGPQSSSFAQQVAFYHKLFGLKHIFSALEVFTRSLIDSGLVDSHRIGISGLSAGSRTAQFAAINSSLFSAGSVGSCCEDPGQDSLLGLSIAENYHKHGWPTLTNDPNDAAPFWSQFSLAIQPRRVKFPILIQAADSEYLAALATSTALSQTKIPSDLFVYPNEYHIKWQPAHRLQVYRRNIAWFDFWLMNRLPDDGMARREAERWSEARTIWRADGIVSQ